MNGSSYPPPPCESPPDRPRWGRVFAPPLPSIRIDSANLWWDDYVSVRSSCIVTKQEHPRPADKSCQPLISNSRETVLPGFSPFPRAAHFRQISENPLSIAGSKFAISQLLTRPIVGFQVNVVKQGFRAVRFRAEIVVPADIEWQGHQNGLDTARGLQPEERTAIVEQIELDISAAAKELEPPLVFG